jgi:diguanylate cyclase
MGRGVGRRLWSGWVLLGCAAVGGHFLLPPGWPREVTYDAIGLASVAAIVAGVRWHRPARTTLWYWFAAGLAVWVAGDLVYGYFLYGLREEPFPSLADACYLAAYPVLVVGLLLLARGRTPGRDLAALLDAGIVAIGLTLLCWAFLMRPIAVDTSLALLPRLITVAYPAGDLLLLVMIARVLVGGGVRNASYGLLVAAVGLQLAADVVYSVQLSMSGYAGGWVDAGWMLSYVAWGAAALHPSMRRISEPASTGPVENLSPRRLSVLAAASLLAPALMLWQGISTGVVIDWPAIGLGAVALFALVLLRMSGLVTQVQLHAARLSHLAMRDELTGLANRRALHQRLHQAVGARSAGPVHVAMVDLDDFKDVNDTLGHHVGDQILTVVAGRISAAVRPTDTVARLGGDEFVIVFAGTSTAEADRLVERVLTTLRQPIAAGGHQLLVQASIGLGDGADTEDGLELLRRADLALYAAKRAGTHGSVRYDRVLDEQTSQAARMGADLRHGIDAGQFHVVYQPIVHLPDGAITAVEALLRWRRPDGLVVSPATFIPIAERTGLIVDLGEWVLREACRQLQVWREELGDRAPAKVSVNVSARQLYEPGFATTVATVLAETGLPARALAVEVTETAVFRGGQALVELTAIQRLGVHIALDDFGTGHSSLSMLTSCPVDILKVDKSFVDGIGAADPRPVIATALISVSAELNLMAVAEGVETADQADLLYQLGYRHAQGYLFARPMAPADLRQVIAGTAAGPSILLRPPVGVGPPPVRLAA